VERIKMVEFITFILIVALAYAGVKFIGEKEEKDEYENINLDDYKDYDPQIPDIDIESPDSNEILTPKKVFELADLEI
jgi:hypothetical protein